MGSGATKPVQLLHKATIAADESKYGSSPAYWDNRYMNEFGQQYDWLQRYGSLEEDSELRQVIREFVPLRSYILNLGAGISRMSEEMNADGYCTILNVDVSGTAVRLMTDHYKRRFGKWVYKVEPTCRRLYARRTTVHGNATDTALHQTLTRLGIGNSIDWLMGLGLEMIAPCFREAEISSPRDLVLLDPTQLVKFMELIDHFMEERERAEHGARGAIVPQSNPDGDPVAAAMAPPPPGVDAQGRTPAMRVQEETVKLRTYLGFDVEQGGAGRCFQGGDSFVVVERRRDGTQEHLRLFSGGWVLSKSPVTFEPLATEFKQLPGGYPPMSIILDPKQANPDMPFLPALDYKQMNGLGLDEIEDDTFDCVLVKGTVDAMLCAGHAGRENALLLLAEAYRVLKPTGLFICISHGGDHPDLVTRRELFLEDFGTFKWKLAQRALPKPMTPGQLHQAYICVPQPTVAGEIWDADEAQDKVLT